jgi:hypothetical protein
MRYDCSEPRWTPRVSVITRNDSQVAARETTGASSPAYISPPLPATVSRRDSLAFRRRLKVEEGRKTWRISRSKVGLSEEGGAGADDHRYQ